MPFCNLETRRERTFPTPSWKALKRYPEVPTNLGEWIRKKRLDLGLTQKELAERLGVRSEAVSNWECGVWQPMITLLPRLNELLGMSPLAKPATFAEQLVFWRKCTGLQQGALAKKLGISPCTIGRWENGRKPLAVQKQKAEAMIAQMTNTQQGGFAALLTD